MTGVYFEHAFHCNIKSRNIKIIFRIPYIMTFENENEPSAKQYSKLVKVIRTLRSENGCPWDKKQTPESFHPYILEEYHELVQALNSKDYPGMVDEAGDLLFLVIFVAFMFEQEGFTSLSRIIEGSLEKMVRRHPHVFAGESVKDADDVLANWGKIKATESSIRERESVLDGIPRTLPALARAQRLAKRAGRVGFDWSDPMDVFEKVQEEISELKEAARMGDQGKIDEEMGDILFALTNAARLFNVNAEAGLNRTSDKFEARFRFIEKELAKQGKTAEEATLEEMDAIWDRAKEQGM
jgi:MazG family protein